MITHEQSCSVLHEIILVPDTENFYVKTFIDGSLMFAAVCDGKRALADYIACFDEDVVEVSDSDVA